MAGTDFRPSICHMPIYQSIPEVSLSKHPLFQEWFLPIESPLYFPISICPSKSQIPVHLSRGASDRLKNLGIPKGSCPPPHP